MPFFYRNPNAFGHSLERTQNMSNNKQYRGQRLWRKVCTVLLLVAAVGFVGFGVLAAWISRDLPDPNVLSTRTVAQSTKIFDRSGNVLLYEIHGDEKRTLVSIQNIPDVAKWATVAVEDKRFYEHHGIYWQGLFRAVIMSVLRQQRVQGTSTLTQQLVKNAILTNERSLMRKLKEFVLAIQIERVYTKDQILQLYFNEIPYGSTIYGIESASQTYFGKPARDLSLDEAALLASIPQRPDFYSPYGTGLRGDNRVRLSVRQHYVLDLMAEQGYITKVQAEDAKRVDTLKKILPKKFGDLKAPHFVMYVRSLLEDTYGANVVAQGGLRVVTTLDWNQQQVAEEEVRRGVDARGKKYGFTNAALVSLDPKTGQILTMVGSKDFFDTTYDGQVNVTLAKRQPGSSFKPIVYAAGFQRGYLPETQLWDVHTVFKTDIGTYEPSDYDGKERGPVTIRRALQNSLNIPAVEMLYLVGVGRVLDFADQLGYTTFNDRSRFGLSLVLGGGEVKPLEHAAAFAAFANDGIAMPTTPLLKVEDAHGATLSEWTPPPGTRVMEPQIPRILNSVLTDTATRVEIFGPNNALSLPDRPVAAKTGTTNNYKDAWTAGYTPNLVAVVWVGNNDSKEMTRGADGSVVAAPIWQAYMKRATRSLPIEQFLAPNPSGVTKPAILGTAFTSAVRIDTISGKRATDLTPTAFVEERTFSDPHSILHYVDREDPLGTPPENPANDPQYINWERGVTEWIARTNWHTTDTAPTQNDDVHTLANQPHVQVMTPSSGAVLNDRAFTIELSASAPRPITRVTASINGVLLGENTSFPWTIFAHLPDTLISGSYDLVVTAQDDIGNLGAVHTPIQWNSPASPSTP